MKKLVLFFFGILFTAAAAQAQSPAPEPDTLRDPVKQTDPEPKTLPSDVNYAEDHIKITPKQVPAAIRQTLGSSPQYQGWEKGNLYKDKSGNLFTLEITRGDTTHTYRFDKRGQPSKD